MTTLFRDLNRALVKTIILQQGARFATVDFVKKDGTHRTMLVQHAATKSQIKGSLGNPKAVLAARVRQMRHPNLMPIYDVDRQAIRSINLDTVSRVTGSGALLYFRDQAGFAVSEKAFK